MFVFCSHSRIVDPSLIIQGIPTVRARCFSDLSCTNPVLAQTESWANLKGGGQLADKSGNGEQMHGKVSGLGSAIGLPSKEDFMSMLNFTSDDGDLCRVCSRVLWGRGGLQFQVLGGNIVLFFG